MKILLWILIILPITVQAQYYNYKVIRVIDADTIVIEAPFLPKPLKPEISVRIFGLDAPEKDFRSHCEMESNLSYEATEFVQDLFKNAKEIKVEFRDWDKYARILGDFNLDGKSLRNILLDKGYAKLYFGSKKENWCD